MRLAFNAGDVVTEEHIALLKRAIAAGFQDPRLIDKRLQLVLIHGPYSFDARDGDGVFPTIPASLFVAAQEYLEEKNCDVIQFQDDEAEALARDQEDAETELANMEQDERWLHNEKE